MHKRQPFDLAHHLNMIGYREPGYLWRLPVPFFWGPIGGAFSPPMKISLQVGGVRFLARYVVNAFQRRFSRRSALAARKASLIWVVTEDDLRMIETWGGRTEMQCEAGTSNISDLPHVRREKSEPLRLVWSGNHISRKALPLALEAMSRLPKPQTCHLDILGSGPKTVPCQSLARRLGIEHLLTWHGRLAQADALAVMSKAHALLHTSICEATATVVLESLALGLPVLCHDAGGMKTAVTDLCGFKVPLRDRATSIDGFCRGIQGLSEPQVYNRLSLGALQRAHELTWDRKVTRINEVYTIMMEKAHD
jgi:glycosyltransferase involved in cell wall biosynthesis